MKTKKGDFTQKTVFECNYCRVILKTKEGIEKHVAKCYANPATRSCRTCVDSVGFMDHYDRCKGCGCTEDDGKKDNLCFHPDEEFSNQVDGLRTHCDHWRGL